MGQAITREVELAIDIQQPPPPIVCDPTQLHQAISNLVDNAIKYSPSRWKGAGNGRSDRADLVVMVGDSGQGIPPKDVPYIFDKFYRVKEKGLPTGVGLGLALVRSIAEAHGGTVRVESVENEGSTFILQLPVANGNNR
jgi:signal transduction histidine kinase